MPPLVAEKRFTGNSNTKSLSRCKNQKQRGMKIKKARNWEKFKNYYLKKRVVYSDYHFNTIRKEYHIDYSAKTDFNEFAIMMNNMPKYLETRYDKEESKIIFSKDVVIKPNQVIQIPNQFVNIPQSKLHNSTCVNSEGNIMIGPSQLINHHCDSPFVFNSQFNVKNSCLNRLSIKKGAQLFVKYTDENLDFNCGCSSCFDDGFELEYSILSDDESD